MAPADKIMYSIPMKSTIHPNKIYCMSPDSKVPHMRMGSRRSQLALVQARMVGDRLRHIGIESQVIKITTTGDTIKNTPLWDIGGKGLFSKQLDTALINGVCDICVHSAKDLPTQLTDNIRIIGFLPRADVRDVLIGAHTIHHLRNGAVLGTSSPRRRAQIHALRPDIRIVPLRGNVPTRLQHCKQGIVDATLLAYAGLHRLQYDMAGDTIENMPFGVVPVDTCIPAAAQGAIAITCRTDDTCTYNRIFPICDPITHTQVMIERAVLAGIDGDCHSPIGVHTHIQGDTVCVQVFVSCLNKTHIHKRTHTYKKTYNVTNAVDNAFKMGQNIKQQLGWI